MKTARRTRCTETPRRTREREKRSVEPPVASVCLRIRNVVRYHQRIWAERDANILNIENSIKYPRTRATKTVKRMLLKNSQEETVIMGRNQNAKKNVPPRIIMHPTLMRVSSSHNFPPHNKQTHIPKWRAKSNANR